MAPPQRTPRERKKPETYVAEPASAPNASSEGKGRGRNRGRGRSRGRGRGKGRAASLDQSASVSESNANGSSAALSEADICIGRRLTVHWQTEGEDFEGYVKQFCPGLKYPYEIAYDDDDYEWGWLSATHFHTNEVSRKYSWLTDQDQAIAKAVEQVQSRLERPAAASATTAQAQPAGISSVVNTSRANPQPVSASTAPAVTGTVGSIAFKKDQLRAARDVLSDKAAGQTAAAASSSCQNGLAADTSTSPPAALPGLLDSHADKDNTGHPTQSPPTQIANKQAPGINGEAPASQDAGKPVECSGEAAVQGAHAKPWVTASAAAKLQLTAGAPSLSRKRKNNQLYDDSSEPNSAAPRVTLTSDAASKPPVGATADASANESDLMTNDQVMVGAAPQQQQQQPDMMQQQPGPSSEKVAKQKAASEKRVKHAHDPQLKAEAKEHKRKRLRKVSEMGAADLQASTDIAQDGGTPASETNNGKEDGQGQTRSDSNLKAQQDRRESNAKATTSASASPAATNCPSQQKSKAHGQKPKQLSSLQADAPSQTAEAGVKNGQASTSGKDELQLKKTIVAAPAEKPSQPGGTTVNGSSKLGAHLHSSKSGSLPPFALPGSASTAISRLPSSLLGGASTSTRISLPPGLTQLSSLRSKTPAADVKAEDSPTGIDGAAEEAAAVAAAAAAESHLKGIMQHFGGLLQTTLQRTKESVHKVTQFAVRAAAGKNGKAAAHRLVVMILDQIETVSMSKRVDLFYLLDSLLQVSLRESKDGSEAKLEASKTFSRVIAAGLHRIAGAMAQDSECISKASKVLELWQRRLILAKSVLKPALDLLSKMRAEHDAAAAAAAMSAYKMGQPLVPRRPLRLVMPFACLDSDTRLPTHTACFALDQWGSLAGFRFQSLDGQVLEFELKPDWTMPLQEVPEDWDINPATEDLPLDQVLAGAAAVRREHLAELAEQKEAKARREGSPWADRQEAHPDYTAASPTSAYHGNDADVDMEQDASPAEGETGYFETAQDSAFQFEPPRAPAHYGASRNSPSDDPSRAGSYKPWVASAGPGMPWAAGSLGGTWSHMGHTGLQPQQSLNDPLSQSYSHVLSHPRLQELAHDYSGQSQSPEGGSWYNVPFDDTAQPAAAAAAGSSAGAQYQHRRPSAEQAVQPQVAVRDSNVDFDVEMGWSDDDAPPPLPAESPPPGPDIAPPLPAYEEPLPPLPPEEDHPPLPTDDSNAPPLPEGQPSVETRLASAGLFEPSSQPAALHPGSTPPPAPPPGSVYGY